MRLRQLFSAALAAALLPALAGGCGGSDGGATVSGEALYAGKPIESGSIQFTPKDGKGAVVGGAITDGKFSVSQVPTGPMVVFVSSSAPVSSVPLTSEGMAKAAEEQRLSKKKPVTPPPPIPSDAGGNNAVFEVKAGSNTLKVELTPPRPR